MFDLLPAPLRIRLGRLATSIKPRGTWSERVEAPSGGAAFSCIDVGSRRILFASVEGLANPDEMAEMLRGLNLGQLVAGETEAIQVGVLTPNGWPGRPGRVIALGITVTSFHEALATLIGLPTNYQEAQQEVLGRTLQPLGDGAEYAFASLRAIWNGTREADAVEWLRSATSLDRPHGALVYLQAEGGKGKSTLLAHVVRELQAAQSGPLPLYVPLRNVLRGVGVSWAQLVRTLGIVGQASENLRQAVRVGLAVPFLDGLDEVSGRYDPNLVMEVADILTSECASEYSVILLSGRTTEGILVGDAATARVRLELPPPESAEFEKYVRAVLRPVCSELSALADRTPEAPWEGPLRQRGLTENDEDSLCEWIRVCFDNYGRDRTLFFVQSLAAVGRSIQLQRNGRLIVHSETHPPSISRWEECSIYDVSVLAASFACVREQSKVDPIATDEFTPSKQLDLLSLLAVAASGQPSSRALAPNAMTSAVFGVDPINNAEVWLAILRQMQKHALLAATADSAAAGEWKPVFLSDWVRGVLLVRAWRDAERLGSVAKQGNLRKCIAGTERGSYSFGSLFPGEVVRGTVAANELVATLLHEAVEGSATACANYWWLRSGLRRAHSWEPAGAPGNLADSMDLTEFLLDGDEIGREFSGEFVFLAGAQFRDCVLNDVRLENCDLSECVFERCSFRGVQFRYCDGPISFDGCEFENCRFIDTRGRAEPLLRFDSCLFDGTSRIVQGREPGTSWRGEAIAAFDACMVASAIVAPRSLLEGECVGLAATQSVSGLDMYGAAVGDPAAQCLRLTLETFCPRRAGAGIEFQARPYIRSSAIGRGALPEGSPGATDLISILEAEGFSDGGRANHLYAPWSQVGGVTDDGVRLRNEIVAFLRGQQPTRRIQGMIEKVRERGTWGG